MGWMIGKKGLDKHCRAVLNNKEGLDDCHRAMLFLALGIRPKKTKNQKRKALQVIHYLDNGKRLLQSDGTSGQVLSIIREHGSITREQLESICQNCITCSGSIGIAIRDSIKYLRQKGFIKVEK